MRYTDRSRTSCCIDERKRKERPRGRIAERGERRTRTGDDARRPPIEEGIEKRRQMEKIKE